MFLKKGDNSSIVADGHFPDPIVLKKNKDALEQGFLPFKLSNFFYMRRQV